ncbi:hypothetical protein KL930_005412, partial [Ogataea haglerorum]
RDVGVVLVDDDVLAEGALGGHSLRLLAGGKYIGAGGKGLPARAAIRGSIWSNPDAAIAVAKWKAKMRS